MATAKKGCLIAAGITAGIVVIFFVLVGIFASKMGKDTVKISNESYIVMDISGPLSYEKKESLFDAPNPSFTDILAAIEKSANDSRIKGMIIKRCAASLAQQEEILQKVLAFKKSGKKIYAYAPSFSTGNYLMASVADEIIIPPSLSADMSLSGYYMPQSFFKRLFDKIGVEFTVVHMGNYKGAGETFSRSSMTPYLRENMESLMGDLYGWRLERIAENRSLDMETFKADVFNGRFFMLTPPQSKNYKLIDVTEYETDFYDRLSLDKKNLISIIKYAQSVTSAQYSDKIAVIIAEGQIIVGKSTTDWSPLSGGMSKMLGSETFCAHVEDAVKDKSIKGIVIRVDSPGGSALASDIMWRSLKKAAEKKPVYISMGQVAASGGYYISAPGKVVFADATTITGSIGVVSMLVNTQKLMENKLYIDTDTIQRGKYSDFGSPLKPMTQEEINILKKMSENVYFEFKSRVSEGRSMSMDDVEKLAQGKVYTGRQALKIGLVDQIGGLEDTCNALKKELNLQNATIVYYPKTKKFFDSLKEGGLFGMSLVKKVSEPESTIQIDPRPQVILPNADVLCAE